MAVSKKPLSRMETTKDGRSIDTFGLTDEQRAAAGVITGQVDQKPAPEPVPRADAYRVVDFVRAVAMHDDRGQEVRVNRVRLGGSVDRDSPMKVESIVLNGAWFDIATAACGAPGRRYRVHVTNTTSAER